MIDTGKGEAEMQRAHHREKEGGRKREIIRCRKHREKGRERREADSYIEKKVPMEDKDMETERHTEMDGETKGESQ